MKGNTLFPQHQEKRGQVDKMGRYGFKGRNFREKIQILGSLMPFSERGAATYAGTTHPGKLLSSNIWFIQCEFIKNSG